MGEIFRGQYKKMFAGYSETVMIILCFVVVSTFSTPSSSNMVLVPALNPEAKGYKAYTHPTPETQVGAYHLYLMKQIKNDPAHTVFGFGKSVRRAWVAKIMSEDKHALLGVQVCFSRSILTTVWS